MRTGNTFTMLFLSKPALVLFFKFINDVYISKGRTNKLVDGCYSLWQGGVFPLLHHVLKKQNDQSLSCEKWMFDQGLQNLICF